MLKEQNWIHYIFDVVIIRTTFDEKYGEVWIGGSESTSDHAGSSSTYRTAAVSTCKMAGFLEDGYRHTSCNNDIDLIEVVDELLVNGHCIGCFAVVKREKRFERLGRGKARKSTV